MESGGFEDIPKIFFLTWNSDNVMQVMIIRSELTVNKTETESEFPSKWAYDVILLVSSLCWVSCFSWLTCWVVLVRSTPWSLDACWAIFLSSSLRSIWKENIQWDEERQGIYISRNLQCLRWCFRTTKTISVSQLTQVLKRKIENMTRKGRVS